MGSEVKRIYLRHKPEDRQENKLEVPIYKLTVMIELPTPGL